MFIHEKKNIRRMSLFFWSWRCLRELWSYVRGYLCHVQMKFPFFVRGFFLYKRRLLLLGDNVFRKWSVIFYIVHIVYVTKVFRTSNTTLYYGVSIFDVIRNVWGIPRSKPVETIICTYLIISSFFFQQVLIDLLGNPMVFF